MLAHAAGDDVGDGEEIGAAVMIDDAFGIPGGARGIIERNGVPLVVRQKPGEIGVALAQKILVFEIAEPLARAGEFRIVVVDDKRAVFAGGERAFDGLGVFAVGDQNLGFAMVEDKGDDGGI